MTPCINIMSHPQICCSRSNDRALLQKSPIKKAMFCICGTWLHAYMHKVEFSLSSSHYRGGGLVQVHSHICTSPTHMHQMSAMFWSICIHRKWSSRRVYTYGWSHGIHMDEIIAYLYTHFIHMRTQKVDFAQGRGLLRMCERDMSHSCVCRDVFCDTESGIRAGRTTTGSLKHVAVRYMIVETSDQNENLTVYFVFVPKKITVERGVQNLISNDCRKRCSEFSNSERLFLQSFEIMCYVNLWRILEKWL